MINKNGFTLVEILIAMVIVITIAIIMIGTFVVINPVAKGRDSQRKKDLNRIKQAFEEYFNDKGYYPQDVNNWNKKTNCGSKLDDFSKYLSLWPCDPNGNPYLVIMEKDKFRVMANLENKDDSEIPKDWYTRKDIIITGVTKNEVNYGVSSPNILWYENYINPNCDIDICLGGGGSSCSSIVSCSGENCYYAEIFPDGSRGGDCVNQCQTFCCGAGCD